MKKYFLILITLLTISFISCSKDKVEEPAPYQPVFDKSTKDFTDFDKHNARYLLTHWQLKYDFIKDNKGKVLKLVGYTRAENGEGKDFNIVENTVGKKPVYVYFQMYLHFEVRTTDYAKFIKDACLSVDTKRPIYALIKNIARPGFDIEKDLPFLQKEISETYVKLVTAKVQKFIDSGHIKIIDYTRDPIKSIK